MLRFLAQASHGIAFRRLVDKICRRNGSSKLMSSKDAHLIASDLALAVWSLMMLVNGQTPSCSFARLRRRNTRYKNPWREPRLLARVDAKLFQIMPKLQILPDKGKVTFNNNSNKRKKISGFKFPARRHLGFYEVTALSYYFNKRTSAFQQ